ncbi:hypothetical protein C7U60_15690 [Mesorhizobium plurifarium]|uniref:cytochrome C oxidase subunit IV family protein n=1 Tax=Sinorhizobium arboris TaxID=76745 RepID=UPI0004810D34|nr:cytochrome C oxidase subunit IV family protein [Sinorhizobium arboris]PST20631.1 hypothetical protein C7U60_15690 [Mesorhizobium plurifarium]
MGDHTSRQLTKTWAILAVMVIAGMLLTRQIEDPVVPLALAIALLILAVLKARLVVLDFLGLRSGSRPLRLGLLAWPMFFAFAAAAKALIATFVLTG